METNSINISSLMGKMIVQLSVPEFCALAQFVADGISSPLNGKAPSKIHQVVGVTPLSTELGCSASFVYALKAKGVLDDAIISRIGKKAVFDVDKARSLANQYQEEQRAMR